jgi:hypothetical protein
MHRFNFMKQPSVFATLAAASGAQLHLVRRSCAHVKATGQKILFLLTASALAGTPTGRPTRVSIIDVPSERRDYGTNIGNIKVRFSDGHSEVWTSLGRCMDAHVSPSGLVGWTRYTSRNHYGEPVNDISRVRFFDGHIKDFQHGPFIEEWAFVDSDSAAVIKSRGRHGPAHYIKYDLRTGKVLGSVGLSTPYDEMPSWAQPLADDRPNA